MKKTGLKILVFILVLLVIAFGGLIAYKFLKDGKVPGEILQASNNETQEPEVVEIKKLKIVDEDSKSRPYAVMINNHHDAWPQCGIQDAYLVYEIIAEGGITRMFALYKDQETAKIGSIRSARHYFIDYAEENDAIFVHWGGSPQAYSRIRSSGINDIDGMALEGSVFFRDNTLKNRNYEHRGFTSMEKLKEYAAKKGFDRDTNKDLLLNYSIDEIDVEEQEGAKSAQEVLIKYSSYHNTSYVYDEENKVYKRSMAGKANVDLVTGKQYTVKNIIVYCLSNYTLNDGENKGRQELNNIGTGDGYYITDGYAVPIKWEKTTHSGQTVYTYLDGKEITVNDGNTFIQIYPKSTGSLTITPKSVETTEEANANVVNEI